MSERQIKKMREVYHGFPDNLKEVLAKIRITEQANLKLIPKSERNVILKDLKKLRDTQKNIINFEVEMPKRDKNIIKNTYSKFCMQVDMLGADLQIADRLIEETRNEIKAIKADYDEYNRAKRKESDKKLSQLKAKQTTYHIAQEVIQYKYDVIVSDSKYGYEAIKIRREIEKSQRSQIKKIDARIDKLMQIIYTF